MLAIGQHHRGQAHERAVAGGIRVGGAAERFLGALEALQGLPAGNPNVETTPGAAQVAVMVPAQVAFHLIARVEGLAFGLAAFDQAFGQAQGHRGVIGPLAGLQIERTAASHLFDGGKGAW